jgi:chromosome segregation protein
MLRLKEIQIVGFKSFGDRTELTVSGNGIVVVVGPNGCGKSNILEAVSWVLGERNAKALRGTHMQDVIFSGTHDRKPLGMAEVTLTMVDPEAYEGPMPVDPAVVVDARDPEDWDEEGVRQRRAAEVEEFATAQQPGQAISDDEAESTATPAEGSEPEALKIRRRKFHTTSQSGEVIITRRLFRTGDSEYLLNGKLCRLRDIQDIFMGIGLGPDSYAIIAQEQISQLLSTKPHERRAVIEEAAGITPFKTKRRLAELRLEGAKQNLARVDDIFEEVARQMNSLKRQAAKAERFAAARDELRGRLRMVIASRMSTMDSDQARLGQEIVLLTARIDEAVGKIADLETRQHALTERGYELENRGHEAQNRTNDAAIELERATARERSNTERVSELEVRISTSNAELEQTRAQMDGIKEERAQHQKALETAAVDAREFRQKAEQRQREARAAAEDVFTAERSLEGVRRQAMRLLTDIGDTSNALAQNEESLFALEREAERLEGETRQARTEQESLAAQISESRMRFEAGVITVKRLEHEIAVFRETLQTKRSEENGKRALANQLRSEQATVGGRRDSLQVLIRNHGYATDTVRQLLKPGALGSFVAPLGTLADFVEVSGEHEGVVDEFLREELNYVVVESWDAAEEGVRVLKTSDGRATFLVHSDAQGELFESDEGPVNEPGLTPLRDAVKVLNGFGHSLEALLPKLRYGYLVADSTNAEQMALRYARAYFLTAGGECFHSSTVTGGHPASEGPLGLKRGLREAEGRLAELGSRLARAEQEADGLTLAIEKAATELEKRGEERRKAETEAANLGAALRQLEAEAQRVERRLEERQTQAARNRDAREAKLQSIVRKRDEATQLEAEQGQTENVLNKGREQLKTLRGKREELQQEAAQITAELAGIQERLRGAEAAFQAVDGFSTDLERRERAIEQRLAEAEEELNQRIKENATLVQRQKELIDARAEAIATSQTITKQAQTLRQQLAEVEIWLKTERAAAGRAREERAGRSNESAKLRSDLEHLEATCLPEVNVEARVLRNDAGIGWLTGEELAGEEEACRGLRQRLEQMGPVNMMALDEYTESSRRHGFLDVQRKDLIDSIASAQETIRELDQISRTKFDEALVQISANFARVFEELFQGGQAYLRATDSENQNESGLDIIASPPGKKLQNVLLLSGGEKALTALALLVGVFQFRPSPFCVLDEIDAPLDEANVDRFCGLMHSLSRDTQFVVITHSKRMMQTAGVLYGVTMQEPGVSKVLSVCLGHQEARHASM